MTTGEIIAFINYVNQILLALMVVANLVITFTKAYASAGRVAEVLDTVSSLPQKADEETGQPDLTAPEVEFRQVSFSYNEGRRNSVIFLSKSFLVKWWDHRRNRFRKVDPSASDGAFL